MLQLRNSKKATIQDKVYVFGVFIALVCIVIAMNYSWGIIHDSLYQVVNGTAGTIMLDDMKPDQMTSWLDILIICVYFALNLVACIILPMSIENNAIYFIVIFIFSFIFTYVCAITANIIYGVLMDIGGGFRFTLFIINNLVLLELGFIALLGLTMYFKSKYIADYYG
jgi:hypothetical protein